MNDNASMDGAPRAAVFISLTPVIAALIALPVLGERPDVATSLGIVAVSLGVALASGAIRLPSTRQNGATITR